MSPRQDPDVPQRPKSNSPSINRKSANNGGTCFEFVTVGKPDEFKSKETMTIVRKKAMDSFLYEKVKDKKPRKSGNRSRLNSEDSTATQPSPGSQECISPISFNEESAKSRRSASARQKNQSAPVKCTKLAGQDQHTSSSRVRQLTDFILPENPIFGAIRTGVPLDYDMFKPPPFASIGKALDPFQTLFQASDPLISVEELKHYCGHVFGTRAMGLYWTPLITKESDAFLSTLCIASAHHDASHGRQVESVRTLALRQEIIYLIGQNLCNPNANVADHNIIALTQLIASEVIAREDTAMKIHEKGLIAMIEKRGGLNQIGMRIASTISWVVLEAAILQEAIPRTIYADFCTSQSYKDYSPNATIPESPIYCPRRDFETIKRSKKCDQRAKDLLNDVRDMIAIFLQGRKHDRPNSPTLLTLCKKLTSEKEYPSVSKIQMTNVLTPRDWKYEAIRITAVIQATAILKRTPLSKALTDAANDSKSRPLLNMYSKASRSDEFLVSPTSIRYDSYAPKSPTSPNFIQYSPFSSSAPYTSTISTSPNSSSDLGSFQSRPSIVSTASSISETSYFPSSQTSAPHAPPSYKPVPRTPTDLLNSLKTALNHSDISDCWFEMAGVLLWIALTIGATSSKEDKVLKKWFSALAMRASIMLCFEHPEAIHATMLRMGEVIEALSEEGRGELVMREGKKRRF